MGHHVVVGPSPTTAALEDVLSELGDVLSELGG